MRKAYREIHKPEIKNYMKRYYLENKELILKKTKEYKKSEKRKPYNREYARRYRKTLQYQTYRKEYEKNHSEYHKEFQREYRKTKNEKIKNKARYLAWKYLKIILDRKCEICHANQAQERHHEDYNKPLEIKYVCRSCHNKLHYEK